MSSKRGPLLFRRLRRIAACLDIGIIKGIIMHLRSLTRGALAATALLIGSLAIPLAAGAQTSDVGVTVNGAQINLEPAPILQDGRVFVPLRGVFENLGASVVYDAGTITATGNGRDIELHIGSTQATVNGQGQLIDVAPFIIGASTYVPLRFVSEALGANVNWDENNRIVAIDMAGANVQPQSDQGTQDGQYSYQQADTAPPPLPEYDQPQVPEQNDLWQPGYWAYGQYGYYWVPGVWVAPPQPGYVWTPGYWSYNNGFYAFNQGYWATSVGFYGGINYGAGYFGNGYVGGRWEGNAFRYNTFVTHVNANVVRNNVYVNRNVYVNNGARVSYNGGGGGLAVRPTAQQTQIMHGPHLGPTSVQQQHVQVASQNRQFLASVNHNRPPVTAVAQPFTAARRPAGFVPVTAADRVATPARPAAQVRLPAAVHAAAPAPARHAPAATAARPAQPQTAPRAAAAAPAYHTPAAAARSQAAQRPAPAAPVYHAPVAASRPQAVQHPVPAAPAYHAPAAAVARPAPARPAAAPARPAPVRPAAAPVHSTPAAPPHAEHTPADR
jgi:hypothetical protein